MSNGNTNNTVFIQKLFTSRDNFVDGNVQEATANTANYVGQEGRIWWDPTRNNFYASDGNTPGGILIGTGGGGGTPGGSNTWVQYNNSGSFGGNPNFTFNSSTNVLSATYFSGDGSNLTNVNLTGAAAGNTTEIQFNTTGNFAASANFRFDTSANRLYTDSVSMPVGTLLSGSEPIVYVITTLTLNQILANSDGTLAALPADSYGNPNEVPAPWAVFQFTTTPSPTLEINDILSGAGVPTPSPIVYIGTGGNSNVVVTSSTFYGLPTPIPTNPTQIPVARQTLNAGLQISTQTDTDIVMTPGVGGGIIWAGNLIPLTDEQFTIGSSTRRIKQAYFGGNTIFIYDAYLGIDQSIGANNGNLIINGGTGLTVGEFIMSGNTLYLTNPAEDFNIGTPGATGNLNVNRPMTVSDSDGNTVFSVTSDGRVELNVGNQNANTPGALNIIASNGGYYHNVTSNGGMIHVTGNDGAATRLSLDNFNNGNGTTSFNALVARSGRGTAQNPSQLLAGDIILRLTATGWRSDTGFGGVTAGGATTSLDFVTLEPTSSTNRGSAERFWNAPLGDNSRSFSSQIDSTGLSFVQPAGATYDANIGITFNDGTRQITAFNDTSAVTSVTVGVGLTQTTTVGDVGIDATGVQSITGTANRVIVTDLGGQNFNLSTPQDLNTSSTLTFANLTITGTLTVSNLVSTGNSVIDSKILNLAANSTSAAQIDQGGIILGNANAAYAVSILYNLTNNHWDTGTTGFHTDDLYAANANIDFLSVQNGGHFGLLNLNLDYPNAYIQSDSNVNSYSQIVSQNHNPGTAASTDLVLVNDIGDDGNHFIDMGINGSNYTDPDFSSTLANDGYLFVNQGNLVIGTETPGESIKFVAGGTTSNDIVLTISNTVISTPGNVNANFFIGNGSQLTGIVAGNITGQVANALVAGTVYTNAQPNITSVGTLTSLTVTGNITSGNANLGNVATANYFVGNGYGLTNINVSNIVGTIANANYAAYAGNVVNSLTINNSGSGAASGATFNGGSPVTISYNTVGAPKADGTGASGTWAISITGNANVANTANAVAGANVSGQVAYAAIANAVAGANVSGQVGNALVAGTVYTNAQPNITSVGTLTGLTSNGVINFANTSNVTLGAVGNLHISGGSANYVLQTNGSNTLSWVAQAGIGAITTITPNALSSSVHIAATVSGNTANIITDATTANTANTIVVRDANGAINVNGWTVGARLTAVNYTATNSDYWIGTTTKNKTITLPNAANGASTGRQYQIADTVHSGNPGTTIAAQSPATVVGNQPSQQGQIVIATYVGTTWYLT